MSYRMGEKIYDRSKTLEDMKCASVWSAVASDITNIKFIHSRDEVGVILNGFYEKQNLRCSSEFTPHATLSCRLITSTTSITSLIDVHESFIKSLRSTSAIANYI